MFNVTYFVSVHNLECELFPVQNIRKLIANTYENQYVYLNIILP